MPKRFVLDQGFPKPVINVGDLDANVEYVHLSDWHPEFAKASTPDWLLYLAAAAEHYDGIVTRDLAQISQEAEVVAFRYAAGLSIVTWRKAINDPVMEWGQLLAYMPQVLKRLANGKRSVFILPEPSLKADNVRSPTDHIGLLASALNVSGPELVGPQVKMMRAELTRRGLDALSAALPQPRASRRAT